MKFWCYNVGKMIQKKPSIDNVSYTVYRTRLARSIWAETVKVRKGSNIVSYLVINIPYFIMTVFLQGEVYQIYLRTVFKDYINGFRIRKLSKNCIMDEKEKREKLDKRAKKACVCIQKQDEKEWGYF